MSACEGQRRSRTLVPCGFSSTSLDIGIHRPPAFWTLTSALGENLKAAIVSFGTGSPDPRTFPGTTTVSPSLACLETWPMFKTILERRDFAR